MSSGHAGPARAPAIERWLPPDVGLKVAAPPPPTPPSEEEIAALQEDARRAGAETGFQEGYQAGYKEGREKAEQEAEAERKEREAREEARQAAQEQTLKKAVAALEDVARLLADPLAATADDLEPELLALVEAVSRRVIADEIGTRPELVQQVLHEALAQLPSRNHPLRVQVHPEDQAIAERYAALREEQITWIPDPEIERGGCVLISGPSRIDATVEARLRQGVDAIWGDVVRPRQDPVDAAEGNGGGQDAAFEEAAEPPGAAPPEAERAGAVSEPTAPTEPTETADSGLEEMS